MPWLEAVSSKLQPICRHRDFPVGTLQAVFVGVSSGSGKLVSYQWRQRSSRVLIRRNAFKLCLVRPPAVSSLNIQFTRKGNCSRKENHQWKSRSTPLVIVIAGWVARGDNQPIDPPPLVKLLGRGRDTIAMGAWISRPLLAPSLPSPGCVKSYNHTTLISPRMEGVVMATGHFLKHRNGVHYCSMSLAVGKRSVWQLFSI